MSSTPTPNPTARGAAPARTRARTGAPRSYPGPNVLIAARARIAWLFREFPHVIVNLSGGKDSTLLLHLALEEATRQDRLPLPALYHPNGIYTDFYEAADIANAARENLRRLAASEGQP